MLVLATGVLIHVLSLGLSDSNSRQMPFVYSKMIKYKTVALLPLTREVQVCRDDIKLLE